MITFINKFRCGFKKHWLHCENTNTAWFVRLDYPGAWFTTILWTFAKNNVKMPTVFFTRVPNIGIAILIKTS